MSDGNSGDGKRTLKPEIMKRGTSGLTHKLPEAPSSLQFAITSRIKAARAEAAREQVEAETKLVKSLIELDDLLTAAGMRDERLQRIRDEVATEGNMAAANRTRSEKIRAAAEALAEAEVEDQVLSYRVSIAEKKARIRDAQREPEPPRQPREKQTRGERIAAEARRSAGTDTEAWAAIQPDIDKVAKDLEDGKITPEEAKRRIDNLRDTVERLLQEL